MEWLLAAAAGWFVGYVSGAVTKCHRYRRTVRAGILANLNRGLDTGTNSHSHGNGDGSTLRTSRPDFGRRTVRGNYSRFGADRRAALRASRLADETALT